MSLGDSRWPGPDDEDGSDAVVFARGCVEFPTASARPADWACKGLAPSCPEGVLARAGARLACLEAAASAIALTVDSHGPWMAVARAQGRAEALVGPRAATEAYAGYDEVARSFLVRAGTISGAFRFALFDLLNWEREKAFIALGALNQWLSEEMRDMRTMDFMAAAHAMLGLREAFDEAHTLQGSGAEDLAKALAIKEALQQGCGEKLLLAARDEYDACSARSEPFHGEFRP